MRQRRTDAYGALAALALVWGYTWVVIKVATHDASPFIVAAVRPAIGALILFAVMALTRRSLKPTPIVPTIILGLLQTTGFTTFQTLGVAAGGAGKISLLSYTMPFWIVILAWPLLGERIHGTRWYALALAAVGLVFVIVPLDARTWLADLFAVVGGLSWAASAIQVKVLRAKYDVELLGLTAWQMVWGAIPMLVLLLFVPHWVHWTASFIGAMAFLSIGSQALAWVLWLFILSRLPAGVAGIASLATPVLAIVFAAWQLHEIPPPSELVGMACILGALVVNALPQRTPATAAR